MDLLEYATWDAAPRLLEASRQGPSGASLAAQVRRQPFAVVLLDEFEKAHPVVWDLFLQVFDDGRLTADDGGLADFRHAIVIATSNLGAAVSAAGLGFSSGPAFAAASVERQVARTFRPELVNRFDRVVVFRPLSRAVMRGLLEKELREVLERRGLRHRSWAVEWDESAIEFLLERGFTPDLGARPVKRAVERHFLAPLAQTILARSHPAGDQFLFVRSRDGRALEVTFVDPEGAPPTRPAPVAAGEAPTVQTIALAGHGAADELAVLRRAHETLASLVAGDAWKGEKEGHLAATRLPGFWESATRFATLSAAERMDRIEAGLRGAGGLLARLERPAQEGRRVPPDLVRRLAERLFLLQRAEESLRAGSPEEVFLAVEGRDSGWSRRLVGMYQGWAQRRGMQLDVLEANSDEGVERWVAAVSGYAAWTLLADELGLHVFEEADADERISRLQARVSVAPIPLDTAAPNRRALLERARRALANSGAEHARVVRRYRAHPSPLVRDAVRGWRSGRLETVLAGDFDLMER